MKSDLGEVFEKWFCKGTGKIIVVQLECDVVTISTERCGKKKELQIRWSTWSGNELGEVFDEFFQ